MKTVVQTKRSPNGRVCHKKATRKNLKQAVDFVMRKKTRYKLLTEQEESVQRQKDERAVDWISSKKSKTFSNVFQVKHLLAFCTYKGHHTPFVIKLDKTFEQTVCPVKAHYVPTLNFNGEWQAKVKRPTLVFISELCKFKTRQTKLGSSCLTFYPKVETCASEQCFVVLVF